MRPFLKPSSTRRGVGRASLLAIVRLVATQRHMGYNRAVGRREVGVSSQTDRDNKKGERWLCCVTAVSEGRLHGRPLILHKERATLCRIVPETVLSTHTHAPPSTHERMTSKSSCGRPRISLGSPQQDFINRSRKFNYRDAFRALNPWTIARAR